MRPQPGQGEAAAGLLTRLEGSTLNEPGAARRLQDPLSFRNLAQIHGAVHASLAFARDAIIMELNGASDNPVVLLEREEIVSGGAYHTPHLTNALEDGDPQPGAYGDGATGQALKNDFRAFHGPAPVSRHTRQRFQRFLRPS